MSIKEKHTADYLEKVRSDVGEYDVIFKDVTNEMDIVLLSTDEGSDPRYKIRDYEPFHRENRKIVHELRSETDFNWTEYGFRRITSLSEVDFDKTYSSGIAVSENACLEQVEQFASTVFDDELENIDEIYVLD